MLELTADTAADLVVDRIGEGLVLRDQPHIRVAVPQRCLLAVGAQDRFVDELQQGGACLGAQLNSSRIVRIGPDIARIESEFGEIPARGVIAARAMLEQETLPLLLRAQRELGAES